VKPRLDEDIRRRFEEAWSLGGRPRIEDFVPEQVEGRAELIEELVRIDIEFAWKGSSARSDAATAAANSAPVEPPPVESYVARFPELNRPETIASLLEEECLARRAGGAEPSEAEYRRRFPGIAVGAVLDRLTGRSPELPEIPGYQVLATLGRGGMGVVYKARHVVLGRTVAVKLPRVSDGLDPTVCLRFLREARSAATLHHPHICPIYEIGEADGRPFFAMGYIEGGTLERLAKAGGCDATAAARITAKLARAVAHAHRRGVLHRDIKPANVLLDGETGEPSLTDFGLAKELSDRGSYITGSDAVVGTPAYMAPEQAAGRQERTGRHSDIYSLGAVLYELLVNRPPFIGTVGEIICRVQTEPPPAPRTLVPALDPELERICLRALAKDPAARHATADDLAADLESWLGEEAAANRSSVMRGLKPVPMQPRRSALPIALGVAVVALGAFVVFRVLSTPEPTPVEPSPVEPVIDKPPPKPVDIPPVVVKQQTPTYLDVFVAESVFLGRLGGYDHDRDANGPRPYDHVEWSSKQTRDTLTRNLIGKAVFQLERQRLIDAGKAAEFYGQASARLAQYGFELGDPGANLKQATPHAAWAAHQTIDRLKASLASKVGVVMSAAAEKSDPPAPFPVSLDDFEGEWVNTDPPELYRLTLRRQRDEVAGTYTWKVGKLSATLVGAELRVRWRQEENARHGTGVIRLSGDGRELLGSWDYDDASIPPGVAKGPWPWSFLRIDEPGRRRGAELAIKGEAFAADRLWPEAEVAFREAMRRDPLSDHHAFRAAETLGVRQRWMEAETLYAEACRRNPRSALAFTGLGWMRTYQGRFAEAVEPFRRAAENDPRSAIIMANYAGALLKVGRREEALRAAEKAVLLGDKTGWVFRELGLPIPPGDK